MKEFKEFLIKPTIESFIGDKIKIDKILNKKITINKFITEPSKYGEGARRLKLQIEFNDEKRIVFSGSSYLTDMIEQVPKDAFPFTTTIVKFDDTLQFT